MIEAEDSETGAHRTAVGVLFLILGGAVGSWVARIPEVQSALGLGDAALGLALLMSALGALVAMPAAGRAAPRVGTRRLAWGAAAAMCALLPLIPLAPSRRALMAALGLYGAATGVLGVAIKPWPSTSRGASAGPSSPRSTACSASGRWPGPPSRRPWRRWRSARRHRWPGRRSCSSRHCWP